MCTIPIKNRLRTIISRQSGITLMETIIALAILSALAVAFLSGVATMSRASIITNERTTAESLARSQVEWVKDAAYSGTGQYSPPAPAGTQYANYTAEVVASPLHSPDDGVQKVTITVRHFDKELLRLESYKVSR